MNNYSEKESVCEELKGMCDTIWGFFIFHRRMAVMIGLIFLVTGVYSFFKIPRESEPEVKVPYGVVMTTYQGASPIEVAEQVTFKLEQRIKTLEDLEEMSSSSSEGVSQIFVEFDASADIDNSIRKLKDKVDEAKASLPDDASDPFVQELSFSNRPIVTFSFFGDMPYQQLLGVVEDIQDEFEKLRGIQSADIVGKRETHILVAVREKDMIQFGLNLRTISQAIRNFHMNSPVGNIEVDDLLYRVRIEADQETVEQVKSIPIITRNDATIYVKDVADVTEEFMEQTTMSRVSKNGEPSKPAISLNIVKKTGENVIKTVDDAKLAIEKLKTAKVIPETVDYLAINDMSTYIRDDFNRLMRNAAGTIGLIFLVLLLALGFKEAFVGGIAIPFTFFVAFTYLYQTGNTFNFLVLFSLILGLGLLVDATIVMMEGIHHYIYEKKMSPIDASLMAVKTFRFPLISGMLTTVAAFVPMLMMSGIVGQFFKFIPITVSTVLISSLIIGLFIIPAYSILFMHAVVKGRRKWKPLEIIQTKREHFIKWLNTHYIHFLKSILSHAKQRLRFYIITTLVFVSAILLPVVGLVKIEGFPLVDIDFMYIDAEAPVGITLDKLDPIVRKVEDIVQKDENIESYVVNLGVSGTGFGNDLGPASSNTHLATMSINFVDKDKRTMKSFEIAEGYKQKVAPITEAEIKVPELRSGPPTGSAIQVRVFGEDYTVLKSISTDIQSQIKKLGGQQVDDDLNTGTAEFTFDFGQPHQKALLKNYNLSVAEVASEVRMAVYPTTAATIKRGDEEIDINLQLNWGGYRPTSIEDVRNIQIQNMQGEYVSLGTLTQADIGASLTTIRHFDGEQAITVSADVGPDQVPADILRPLTAYLNNYQLPEGYEYKITGANEDTMQSFQDLFNAMGIGILLIFLILITQFNSFKQPFVILMALPLSLIGVLYGFFIFGLNIGVATMIGIVALSGIVINDAIILIDRININRREKGMSLKEAIIEAGPARLQPIIITSVTTVLGVLPISLTDPFWLTLGMAIVFGMMFSTVLTLVVVPILYYSAELKNEMKKA